MSININGNDYYHYIEQGKNIFRNFDFTVTRTNGELVRLDPVFPALVHLVSSLNKNPILAIKWLNALSLSLSLIPLFLFASSSFNKYTGLTAVILFISMMGIARPLYSLSAHIFLILPITTVCWLTWDITHNNRSKTIIVITGILISIATLTRGYAIIYLGITIFYLLCEDKLSRVSRSGYALKNISYLLLGFLPLFIFYTSVSSHITRGKIIYEKNTTAFLSGNYIAEGDYRDRRFYSLNDEGTEFSLLTEMRRTSIINYCVTYPGFIARKYVEGFNIMLGMLGDEFNPFSGYGHPLVKSIISAILIALAVLGILPLRFNRSGFYLLVWLSPLYFIPLILVKTVYLVPFFPFCAVILANGGYRLYSLAVLKHRRYVKICIMLICSLFIIRFVAKDVGFYKNMAPTIAYENVGLWIKKDALAANKRIKIMARKTIFSYLADAEFLAVPYEKNWNRLERFARLKNVGYIVLDTNYYKGLLKDKPSSDKIKMVYEYVSRTGHKITVYKLL